MSKKQRNVKKGSNQPSTSKKLYFWGGVAIITAAGLIYSIFGQSATKSGPVTYTADIQPVLAQKCLSCHNPNGPAKTPLDTYANVKDLVTPGDAANSRLIKAVDGGSMSGRLSGSEIELFKTWVKGGAKE